MTHKTHKQTTFTLDRPHCCEKASLRIREAPPPITAQNPWAPRRQSLHFSIRLRANSRQFHDIPKINRYKITLFLLRVSGVIGGRSFSSDIKTAAAAANTSGALPSAALSARAQWIAFSLATRHPQALSEVEGSLACPERSRRATASKRCMNRNRPNSLKTNIGGES